MGNIGQLANRILGGAPSPAPYGAPPLPQGPVQTEQVRPSYPPAPQLHRQQKPTEISMKDFKYNAFNVDEIKVNITSRGGFDGVKPDLMIWQTYQYNVTQFKANADEVELSNYLNWALQSKGLKETKIDFHDGQRVTLSGKYPLMGVPIPFSAEIQVQTTSDQKILLTIDDFKTGFSLPGKLRSALLDLFVGGASHHQNSPMLLNPMDAFDLTAAMHKVNDQQIEIDFTRMPVPLDLPISKILTHRYGIELEGGTPQKP